MAVDLLSNDPNRYANPTNEFLKTASGLSGTQQTRLDLNRTATSGYLQQVAGNFSGGFTVKMTPDDSTGFFRFENVQADDFKIEHPDFITFYKARKHVLVLRLSEIVRIDAR